MKFYLVIVLIIIVYGEMKEKYIHCIVLVSEYEAVIKDINNIVAATKIFLEVQF